MEIIITGLVLGGTYALVALGLNIQYGIAGSELRQWRASCRRDLLLFGFGQRER